jgi:radical SAM-linked protein
MIGLPSEEDEDIQDIIGLAKQVSGLAEKQRKRAKLNIHISTFVPKSHTPFMWVPQISLEESRRRMQLVREQLRGTAVRVKWNYPEVSWVEGVFSRGDRRLSKAIVEAWKLGARFDSWSEHFHMETWKKAFKLTGIEPHFFLHRERSLDEILPWDHIRSGINKDFFRREWERAQRGKVTPDCREKCLECGVCDHIKVDPILFSVWVPKPVIEKKHLESYPTLPKKIRLTFTKLNNAKFLSHLELVRAFVRALRRAGLRLVYSKGFHPMPKLSFASALPVGTESMQESVDIEIADSQDLSSLKGSINSQLPSGINITDIEEIAINKKKERLQETHFIITLNGVSLKKEHLDRFLESDYFPVVKVTKKGEHKINARPLVISMSLDAPNRINLVMRQTSGPGSKPAEIVRCVFSLNESHLNDMKILKTSQILG